jgi:hypothetical protein
MTASSIEYLQSVSAGLLRRVAEYKAALFFVNKSASGSRKKSFVGTR